jgi:hypothetical protein
MDLWQQHVLYFCTIKSVSSCTFVPVNQLLLPSLASPRNTYMHTHTYTYIHTYIHTYIYTYIHICSAGQKILR